MNFRLNRAVRPTLVTLLLAGLPLTVALTALVPSSASAQVMAPVAEITLDSLRVKIPVPANSSADRIDSLMQETYNQVKNANQSLGRYIQPRDVIILCPVLMKNGKPAIPVTTKVTEMSLPPAGTYAIYALGRKLITVDAALAKANGQPSAKLQAIKLAKQFMQLLPSVCYAPPTLPSYTPPANPPVNYTYDLSAVVPKDVTSRVELWGKPLFKLAGIQDGNQTPPDRAALLNQKVGYVIGAPGKHTPDEIIVVKLVKNAKVLVGTKELFSFSASDALANQSASSLALAEKVALTIKNAMMEKMAPPVEETAPPVEPTTPPVETTPPPPSR